MIAIAAGEDKRYLVDYLHIDNADWLTETNIRAIAQRYRAATQYEHIFIDLSFLQNTEAEILEALCGLYVICPANLILLACGCEAGDKLLSELVRAGMYNIITAESPGAVNADATACIKGKTLKDVQYLLLPDNTPKQKTGFRSLFAKREREKKPAEIQQRKQLRIGVAGAVHRIGATTQAIQIARYFQHLGWKACYIQCDGSRQLDYYPYFWDAAQQDKTRGCIRLNDLDLYPDYKDQLAEDYEVLVYDYGLFSKADRLSYLDKNKKMLVCGYKPQELLALPDIFDGVEGSEVFYLFSFTAKEDEKDVLKAMADKADHTFFSPYAPSIFNLEPEMEPVLEKIFGGVEIP